ncbi:substrate-binding domain-containing protein [Nostocoides vanveenii]|uniref:substrate-binding domain-containing protein n=1 Tax=Nostocoides vanveenii TaxID=330835 RepID=UPI0031D1246D
MGRFRAAGLRVPEDISVVGVDDSALAALEMVSLTSVRQSVEEFGLVAVDIVQDRMRGADGPRRVDRLATTLVERSTTAPAPAP